MVDQRSNGWSVVKWLASGQMVGQWSNGWSVVKWLASGQMVGQWSKLGHLHAGHELLGGAVQARVGPADERRALRLVNHLTTGQAFDHCSTVRPLVK
jgi:hypothetical protein